MGRARVFGPQPARRGLHPRPGEPDEVGGVDQLGGGSPDSPDPGPPRRDVLLDDGAEVVAGVVDDPFGVVEGRDRDDLGAVAFLDASVPGDPPFVGDVGQVLDVVEEGHGVGVGSEPQHLAPGCDEPLEGRAGAEVVVQRRVGHELCGETTPGAEAALRVVADDGAGRGAEHLRQHSDVGIGGRGEVVERLGVFQMGRPLALRQAVDPVVVVAGAEHHHHRPSGPTARSRKRTLLLPRPRWARSAAARHAPWRVTCLDAEPAHVLYEAVYPVGR